MEFISLFFNNIEGFLRLYAGLVIFRWPKLRIIFAQTGFLPYYALLLVFQFVGFIVCDEKKSKSEKKREAHARQQLGVSIAELPDKQLHKIPLPADVLEVVAEMKKIKSNRAKKRYAQYIGRMMREIEDIEPIQKAFDKVSKGNC